MKKLLILLTALFLFSSLNAQIIRNFGFKTGVTVSDQEWDLKKTIHSASTDNIACFNFGTFLELFGTSNFSLVTELNYVKNKIESTFPVINDQGQQTGEDHHTMNGSLDYLNISALCKFRVDLIFFSPYLIAGPKLDIELDKSFNSIDALYNDLADDIKSERFGAKVGIGSEFNLLNLNLLAEVLYDFNFKDLSDNENGKITTSGIDLRVGVMF